MTYNVCHFDVEEKALLESHAPVSNSHDTGEAGAWPSCAPYFYTLAGATAAVLLIVQYLKPILPQRLPTRWLALIVALAILEGATAIAGGTLEAYGLAVLEGATAIAGGTLEAYGLAVLNAVLVASSAMGAYQVTFAAGDAAKAAQADEGGAEAGDR